MNKKYGFGNRDIKIITFILILSLVIGLALTFQSTAQASPADDQEMNGENPDHEADALDESQNQANEGNEKTNEKADKPKAPVDEPDEPGQDSPVITKSPKINTYKPGELGPSSKSNILSSNGGNGGEPGSLIIDKWADPHEDYTNRWKVTLSLRGENLETTSDIVLVLDRSTSMNGTKLTKAKNAAKNFVNSLLTEGSNTRIALVAFGTGVTVYNQSDPFKDHNGRQTLINNINSISDAVLTQYTHTQAAIHAARNLLAGSTAQSRNIVLLSDGEPTRSYALHNTSLGSGNFIQVGNVYHSRDDLPESAFDYSSTVGGTLGELTTPVSLLSNRYYHHGNSAVAESRFAKNEGYVIYTIALDAGTTGNNILSRIASPGKAYTGSDDDLEEIFQDVAGEISAAATNAVITDVIGEEFILVDPPGITVSSGTYTWDSSTRTITWNLGKISEDDPKTNPATMWYIVEAKKSAESQVLYPTNEEAYVIYTNVFGEDNQRQDFPKPEVSILNVLVQKKITGNLGDLERQFPFEVTISSNTKGKGYETPAVFSLSHNQKKVLYHLPDDAVITLKETNNFSYEVTVTASGIDGPIEPNDDGAYIIKAADLKGDKTITVTNHKEVNIDTGVSLDSLPYIIILALVIAGIIALILVRRRQISNAE